MHEGIDCQKRKKVRCFLLVRDPIERFLSYYEERTALVSALPSTQRVLGSLSGLEGCRNA